MLIDMTHTITPEIPVYPDTPAPVLTPACTLTRNGFRETALSFSSHTGTHMDAPAHLLPDGRTLDQMPMSQFSGRATVLDVSGQGSVITEAFLQSNYDAIHCADFILFYTGWEERWGSESFLEDTFPVPDEAAAKYLISRVASCAQNTVEGQRADFGKPVPEKGAGEEGLSLLRPADEVSGYRRRADPGLCGAAGEL